MKVRTTLCLALAFGVGLPTALFYSPVAAKEAPRGKEDKKAADPKLEGAEAISAAYTLIKIGRETKSPEMLLAAARIIGGTKVSKLEYRDGKTEIKSKTEEVDQLAEAVALIEEAIKMSGKNSDAVKTLASTIRNDIKESKRGEIHGPQQRNGVVERSVDQFDSFDMQFRGNQPARIWLHNQSGQGDLDLIVVDLDGRTVARDARPAGSAFVQFFPSQTNWYTVRVKAYSDSAPVHYRLVTN